MASLGAGLPVSDAEVPSLSKNQLKKIRRDERWEAGREARKDKRRQRMKAKKQKRRAACGTGPSVDLDAPVASSNVDTSAQTRPKPHRAVQLPVTIIIDCGFDDLMNDKERKSLSSQITRCYSDNQKSLYRAHIGISSFDGPLKDRFDGLLSGNHRGWKGVRFLEGEFTEAADQAKDWMQGSKGRTLAGVFEGLEETSAETNPGPAQPEVVYLTSDSPETLSRLQPHGVYILGGLVDRNRYKGVCYKRAMDKAVRTAKLPIGDYMQMNSRFVLTVNQVVEILLRWLEFGDWGRAFINVMPKRKGGMLRVASDDKESSDSEWPQTEDANVEANETENPGKREGDDSIDNRGNQPTSSNGHQMADDTADFT